MTAHTQCRRHVGDLVLAMFLLLAAAGPAAATNTPPTSPVSGPDRMLRTRAEVELHLEETIIHEIDFRQASIKHVVRVLSDQSKVNIVLRADARNHRSSVSFKAREMSVGQTLRTIMKVTGLTYVIRGNVVVIGKNFDTVHLRTYSIPQTSMNDARTVGVRPFLEELGVPFPRGSIARYEFGNGKLIVRNTTPNLEKLERVVRALGGTPQYAD